MAEVLGETKIKIPHAPDDVPELPVMLMKLSQFPRADMYVRKHAIAKAFRIQDYKKENRIFNVMKYIDGAIIYTETFPNGVKKRIRNFYDERTSCQLYSFGYAKLVIDMLSVKSNFLSQHYKNTDRRLSDEIVQLLQVEFANKPQLLDYDWNFDARPNYQDALKLAKSKKLKRPRSPVVETKEEKKEEQQPQGQEKKARVSNSLINEANNRLLMLNILIDELTNDEKLELAKNLMNSFIC